MASLTEVVKELKGQNDTLEDVKSALKGMLDIDLQKQKDEAAQELIDKENAIEARRSKARRVSSAPKTFAGGVASGLGVTDIFDSMKNALGGIGAGFGGMLGGMTLGSLLGKALGKLFVVGAGAYLGSKFFDDEIINKFIPDAIENIKIGDFELGDFSAEIAGALALLFGPKLIGKMLSKGFGVVSGLVTTQLGFSAATDFLDREGQKELTDKTKRQKAKFGTKLIKGIGLGALLAYVGTLVGEEVGKMTGSEGLGKTVTLAAQSAGIAYLFGFGPMGIAAGLLSFAFLAGGEIRQYLRERAEEAKAEFQKKVAAYAEAHKLDERSDRQLIAEAQDLAKQEAQGAFYNRESIDRQGFSRSEAAEAYLQELEKRDQTAYEAALLGEEIEYLKAELLRNSMSSAPQPESTFGNMSALLQEYKALTGNNYDLALSRPDNLDNTITPADLSMPVRPDNFDNTSMPAPATAMVSRDKEYELMKQSVAPGNQGEREIEEFLRTGKFPKYTGPATPAVDISNGEISSGVVKQTINAEDAQIVNNNNVVINNIDYSDRKQTSVVQGGDTPIHLPGLTSATDDRFTSKMEKLMGTAKFVGNSYP